MRTQVRDTSILTYDQLKAADELTPLQRQIVELVRAGRGRDFSRKEISRQTGLEINTVAGRVNELVSLGVLVDGRCRQCTVTHRYIHPVRLQLARGQADVA
jgi:AraC-like DNA-binding protein